MTLNLIEATRFLRLLHGQVEGVVAWLTKQDAGMCKQRHACPGKILKSMVGRAIGSLHIWVSVASFRDRRHQDRVLDIPALWADLDPEDGPNLDRWRSGVIDRLRAFNPPPTLVIDSGRGFHGYWILDRPLRIRAPHQADLVIAANRTLARFLDGDCVSDLARVMRLPGTINPKNGRPCRILCENGPSHRFEDLLHQLDVSIRPRRPRRPRPVVTKTTPLPRRTPEIGKMIRRARGRPRLGATTRDLRSLKPWARHLVIGGAWRARGRYDKPGGGPDRSRADLAAVSAMVEAGWSFEKILAAFERTDWLIGVRFRELCADEGRPRALDYLSRSVGKAGGM